MPPTPRCPASRQWIGIGFLFRNLVKPKAEKSGKAYRIWPITNKHILTGLRKIFMKFNSAADPHSKDYEIPPGNYYDNAALERFMSTLIMGLVHDRRFSTREEAGLAIFEYTERFVSPLL